MLLSLIIIAAVLFVLERISLKDVFRDLSYDFQTDRLYAECGEELTLTGTLVNAGIMPLLHVRLREYMPEEVQFETGSEKDVSGTVGGEKTADDTLYLLGRQKVTRTIRARMTKRGRYLLGSARITVGDLLGLDSRTKRYHLKKELVVYPKPADIRFWQPQADDYLGSVSVQRFILPDPIETVGFRDYTGREPMKDISWPKSLASGRMTVKQYEYLSDPRACLIVDIADALPSQIEEAYSAARSVADMLEERHIPFSFHTNAYQLTSGAPSQGVMCGSGDVHLHAVYEMLGRGAYESTMSSDSLIEAAAGSRDFQKAYFLIRAAGTDRKKLRISELRYGIRILSYPGKEEDERTSVD